MRNEVQGRGKLYLTPRYKRYSTHSTLYATSTIVSKNSQDVLFPLASVDLDCCLSLQEKEQLSEIPFNKPLTNILSSVEDLKIVCVKIDEIQEMITTKRRRNLNNFFICN
jgi:hypothetical protein